MAGLLQGDSQCNTVHTTTGAREFTGLRSDVGAQWVTSSQHAHVPTSSRRCYCRLVHMMSWWCHSRLTSCGLTCRVLANLIPVVSFPFQLTHGHRNWTTAVPERTGGGAMITTSQRWSERWQRNSPEEHLTKSIATLVYFWQWNVACCFCHSHPRSRNWTRTYTHTSLPDWTLQLLYTNGQFCVP